MEKSNKNKKYRIGSVYYEFSGREVKDSYSQLDLANMSELIDKWSDYDFDKTDGYIYFDDLEKELVPPELTPAERKRFIEYLEKGIEVVNK